MKKRFSFVSMMTAAVIFGLTACGGAAGQAPRVARQQGRARQQSKMGQRRRARQEARGQRRTARRLKRQGQEPRRRGRKTRLRPARPFINGSWAQWIPPRTPTIRPSSIWVSF